MKFPYASYEVDPSPTLPDGVVYRPELTVHVIGPRRAERIQALVDTGSDETVFPISLANAIGIQLEHASTGQASAVGGHAVEIIPGRVTLQIAQSGVEYRWHATVGFLEVEQPEDEVALLGYAGLLEFFTAMFDSEQRQLELTPNSRFHAG
jgi:predicted aspartyl protease